MNRDASTVITSPPINVITLVCETTAPLNIIQELGASKNVQEMSKFTYSGYEFRIVDVDVEIIEQKQNK